MIALLRMIAVLLVIETIFYVLISIYLKSTKRESLEDLFDARHPGRAGPSPERRDFVRRLMRGYDRTLRARLVALVYVIPTLAILVIIYLVNWQ